MPEGIERGFTATENVPGQSQSRASKRQFEAFLESPDFSHITNKEEREQLYACINELAEAYSKQFESGENKEKWDWRKQAYVAWSSVPKSKRYPKTIKEFADFIGLSTTSTIRNWRLADPEINKRITELPKLLLHRHVADVLSALVTVASDPIPQAHQDRKLFLEITEVHNPKSDVNLRGLIGSVTIDDPLDEEEQARVEAIMQRLAAET